MPLLDEMARRYGLRPSVQDLQREASRTGLHRTLGWKQLAALGVGAIVGAGVFSTTGFVAATKTGPAIAISFLIAAVVALLAALAYAELAAMIPMGGSAYTYAYAASGELFAWLVAWSLLLSYGIGNAAVASSFSDNLTGLLGAAGLAIPDSLAASPLDGGLMDLPAFLVIALVTVLLLRPINESARANAALVVIKVGVLLLFLAVAIPRVDAANLTPFAPFGVGGILAGAGLIFFAFLGFDAISTAAEEVKDPQRNMPKGILASLAIVTVLFVALGVSLTGLTPFASLNNGEPLAVALRAAGLPGLGAVMNLGGIIATLSVLLVFHLGTSRIILALSRDGLVPKALAKLHPRHHTPNRTTILVGAIVAFFSAFFPLAILIIITNVATLFIFGAAMYALLVLRKREPDAVRPFRCPGSPWVPLGGLAACVGLAVVAVREEPSTAWGFMAWMALGLMIYGLYGASHSTLRAARDAGAPTPIPGEMVADDEPATG